MQEASEGPSYCADNGQLCIASVTSPRILKEPNAPAGWQFLFKRCAEGTALQIALTPENAENILTALSGKAPFPDLDCVQDMCATFPVTETLSENATVLVAFNTLALVCKNTQVRGICCHSSKYYRHAPCQQ